MFEQNLAPLNSLPDHTTSRRLRWEVIVVLTVTFGQSAVYAILRMVERLTRSQSLAQQTTTMNASAVPDRAWLDLLYQIAYIGFGLAPAILVIYLLGLSFQRPLTHIGFTLTEPVRDLARGFLLLLAIAIPGLGFYLLMRALGLNTQVVPTNLTDHWWTIPVLIGLAAMNGISEEVVMVGWLFTRLGERMWSPLLIVVTSAVIRGSYHLYQGWGGFVGNIIMGIILGLVFLRWRRVMPLVIFHTLIDTGAFVGYPLAAPFLSGL